MLRADDIDEAIKAGVITKAQADGLQAFASARRNARVFAVGREERFKLLGGFNDFFIALGVFLLGVGFTSSNPLIALAALGMFWGLAEYLTGRLKLVAPSIVIVGFLAVFALKAFALTFTTEGAKLSVGFFAPVAIVAAHYARFRLPFSLFVLAATSAAFTLALVNTIASNGFGLSPEAAGLMVRWAALAVGLAIFGWAMYYDLSDRERLTRRADCGFWLHLIAAPLIVHPLAGPLINHPFFALGRAANAPAVTGSTIVLILALVGVLSLIALIVDRRALLVAGLGYLGSALAYTISSWSGGSGAYVGFSTLVVMGGLIITLGVGWRSIRANIMTALPGTNWKDRLPPYQPSSQLIGTVA
jgi:hypothetical protein